MCETRTSLQDIPGKHAKGFLSFGPPAIPLLEKNGGGGGRTRWPSPYGTSLRQCSSQIIIKSTSSVKKKGTSSQCLSCVCVLEGFQTSCFVSLLPHILYIFYLSPTLPMSPASPLNHLAKHPEVPFKKNFPIRNETAPVTLPSSRKDKPKKTTKETRNKTRRGHSHDNVHSWNHADVSGHEKKSFWKHRLSLLAVRRSPHPVWKQASVRTEQKGGLDTPCSRQRQTKTAEVFHTGVLEFFWRRLRSVLLSVLKRHSEAAVPRSLERPKWNIWREQSEDTHQWEAVSQGGHPVKLVTCHLQWWFFFHWLLFRTVTHIQTHY